MKGEPLNQIRGIYNLLKKVYAFSLNLYMF